MKAKCIQYKELPKLEGQQYSSFSATFEWMEGEVKQMKEGLTKSKFEVGKEFDIIIEEREGKTSGKKYNYFTKEKTQEFGAKKSYKDPVGTIISTAMSYALDLYLTPPFSTGKIEVVYNALVSPMLAAHAAMLTDREKEFVSYAMSYAVRTYSNQEIKDKFRKAKKVDGTVVEQELEIVVSIFHHLIKCMLDVNKKL